jgi:hypothetical protein
MCHWANLFQGPLADILLSICKTNFPALDSSKNIYYTKFGWQRAQVHKLCNGGCHTLLAHLPVHLLLKILRNELRGRASEHGDGNGVYGGT